MSGSDHGRFMLARAEGDLSDLRRMLDVGGFSEPNFGFRAQQAVEKALKAWLIALDAPAPRTHDLGALLRSVPAPEPDTARHRDLVELNPFAVEFRYAPMPEDLEPLDRPALVAAVTALLDHVRGIVAAAPDESV